MSATAAPIGKFVWYEYMGTTSRPRSIFTPMSSAGRRRTPAFRTSNIEIVSAEARLSRA